MKKNSIPIIDLFAGPGGLSEGFSSFKATKRSKSSPFKIIASIEKDEKARETLLVRSYYRQLIEKGLPLDNYYQWLNNGSDLPMPETPAEKKAMEEAEIHAILHTLGKDKEKDSALEQSLLKKLERFGANQNTVLIGGPPCQAYSLIGRARNKGTKDYKPSKDHRHFLYREYLRIVEITRPSVFIMENVGGILSSKIDERKIFPEILRDMAAPYKAMGKTKGDKFRIYSLIEDVKFEDGDNPEKIDGTKFKIESDRYGIPQKRHRVILMGIRSDLKVEPGKLIPFQGAVTVRDAIADLPALRSGLSQSQDSAINWQKNVTKAKKRVLSILSRYRKYKDVENLLKKIDSEIPGKNLTLGDRRLPLRPRMKAGQSEQLHEWYSDSNLNKVLNHETRGHMYGDLKRYLFASAFTQIHEKSPTAKTFPRELAPNHKNWKSGKFADRFKAHSYEKPSLTVASHISKDGNYYIHPDPRQCRSLTVREAARLQTFPDNYFFMGERTDQFIQVGNAVPPFLAHQIAKIVHKIISDINK